MSCFNIKKENKLRTILNNYVVDNSLSSLEQILMIKIVKILCFLCSCRQVDILSQSRMSCYKMKLLPPLGKLHHMQCIGYLPYTNG